MGKRAISDLAAEDEAFVKPESQSRKKSRRDKIERGRKPASSIPTETTTEIIVEGNSVGTSTENAGYSRQAENISKAERKAAKKARKEAKEMRLLNTAAEADGDLGDKRAAKAVRKAARKAEKKKLKNLAKVEASYKFDPYASFNVTSTATANTPTDNGSFDPSGKPATNSGTYTEHKQLSSLPQSEIDTFLSTNLVTIDDPLPSSPKFRPIIQFDYLPITEQAQRAPFVSFKAPTPIQAATWPSLLSGRDLIGVAETGSGKTLAFGVPCVNFISSMAKSQQKGIKAVIVSPTRELAVQIHDQLVQLATPVKLRVVCVYGGVPKDPQAKACQNAHIVVATPGRLNDLIGDGSADLSKAKYVVLDEADRMLEKGFEEAIRQIISCTPKQRQTLMFTATWPPSIRELAATFLTSPVRITIGDNPSGELRANARIKQLVEVVEPRQKEFRLMQLLKKYQSGKNKDDRILVFCLYKKEAIRVENFIRQKGFRVGGIHGDLSQERRTASLQAFKAGEIPLLVATDVAARGLDIPAVKVVINNTFPLTVEDYVHRIGRTGRAGKEGLAITLFTEQDKHLSGALINVLKAANQPVPEELLKFGTTVKKKGHDAYGAFFKDVDTTKKATKVTFD